MAEEINALEQKFIELLQYNVAIKDHLYAKFYLKFRELFKNESEFTFMSLDIDQGK